MRVRSEDMENICKEMKIALEAGKKWMAYDTNSDVGKSNDFNFFNEEREAEEFCNRNYKRDKRVIGIEIQPAYQFLEQINHALLRDGSKQHSDELSISYSISDWEFKTYPRQKLIDEALKRNLAEVFKFKPIPFEIASGRPGMSEEKNREQLQEVLGNAGFNESMYSGLEEGIRMNNPEFTVSLFKEFEQDKVHYKLQFEKDEALTYSFTGFEAQLFHVAPVGQAAINGVNIQELDAYMKGVDWYYEYSESQWEWEKGFVELEGVYKGLELLKDDDRGIAVAAQLWNNHVPLYTFSKPPFIREWEEKSGLYPSARFSPDEGHTAEGAYTALKEMLQIEAALKQYSLQELKDPRDKVYFLEQIQKGRAGGATLETTFIPASQIKQYRILEHAYPSGVIYETGHSFKKGEVFNNYADALNEFEKQVTDRVRGINSNEFLLIGEYSDRELKLDYECLPKDYTGIVVASASYNPGVGPEMFLLNNPHDFLKDKFSLAWNPHSGAIRFFQDGLIVNPSEHFNEDYSQLKNNSMNQENLEFLKNNLKFSGFGDKLNADLEAKINLRVPEFVLNYHSEFNKKSMDAVLHFKRGGENEMYFFNKYDATLKSPETEDKTQTFLLNKGSGITLREAFNLLEGRAVNKDWVNKEGNHYNASIQLDLTRKDEKGQYVQNIYHQNYGYDLEKALSNLPLKEMKDNERDLLVRSLQKGDLKPVTFLVEGQEKKMFIAANPKYKNFTVFDENMDKVRIQSKQAETKTEGLAAPDSNKKKEAIGDKSNLKENTEKKEEKKGMQQNETLAEERRPGKGKNKKEAAGEVKDETKSKKTGKGKTVKDLLPQREGKGKGQARAV